MIMLITFGKFIMENNLFEYKYILSNLNLDKEKNQTIFIMYTLKKYGW